MDSEVENKAIRLWEMEQQLNLILARLVSSFPFNKANMAATMCGNV